jgi:hypothetical protein
MAKLKAEIWRTTEFYKAERCLCCFYTLACPRKIISGKSLSMPNAFITWRHAMGRGAGRLSIWNQ